MCFPLHDNAVNNSAGLEASGDCNGVINNGFIKVLGHIIAMGLLLLVLLPVLLLLKNSVPRAECILVQVGKVRGYIVLRNDYPYWFAGGVLQGSKAKVGIKVIYVFQ